MQLTNANNITAALALASCSLLGMSDVAAAAEQQQHNWQFDTALLVYSETDRVSAAEVIIDGTKEFSDDHFLNLRLTVDTLTGASANGAIAQPNVQTFTRASGNGQFQIAAGEVVLDDTFHDTRVQLNGQWSQPMTQNLTASGGFHVSKEYDYLSLGLNSNLAYDFNRKNSTFAIGFSYFNDTFSPEGGIPSPYATMLIGDPKADDWAVMFDQTRVSDQDDKSTLDLLVGFTQVINRRMITQFNYSYSVVDGYLNDPFKVLSVVNQQGLTQSLVYESRPDKRVKHSVFAQTKYHFDLGVLDLSYRYLWDDWGITSHTVDSHYRIEFNGGHFIEPHFRYYQQQAADFYRPYLNDNQPLPLNASSDYRIGEMDAITLGLKYGIPLQGGNTLAFRVEYYSQQPKNTGLVALEKLVNIDLYPKVNALMFQVSYSF